MDVKCSLTILFDPPFWVGLYERTEGDRYEVCKVTFGAEPKDNQVYEFYLRSWRKLRFSPPVKVLGSHESRMNPKRMKREISGSLRDKGMGTKAQQALRLQYEQSKQEKKQRGRQKGEMEKERKFHLRREKKREKHKGR